MQDRSTIYSPPLEEGQRQAESTAGYLQSVDFFTSKLNPMPEIRYNFVPWTCPHKYRDEGLTPNVIMMKANDPLASPPVYVDQEVWSALKDSKREFSQAGFREARDKVYAFSGLGSGTFSSRSALHLAALDSAFQLTGSKSTSGINSSRQPWSASMPFDDRQYGFVDLAAAPGSWSEYVFYRHPRATGVGISLISNKPDVPDWKPDGIIGPPGAYTKWLQGNGDLYTQWKEFEAPLSDLVMFDGGFSISESEDAETQLESQEYRYSRLWTAAVAVALRTSKPGAVAVFKTFDLVTNYSAQLLYLMSWAWSTITLYKPPTSRPLNAEVFIIADGFQGSKIASQLISDAMDNFSDDRFATSIFRETLPFEFTSWLTERNDVLAMGQIEAASTVLAYMNKIEVPIPVIDPVQVFIKWHIPGSIPRKSIIKFARPRNPRTKDAQGNRSNQRRDASGVSISRRR
jgi:23S rRNA U2552 (ribose-2'-O)-methylase RlmE/FtsJ